MRLILLPLAVVVALVLPACGGSSGGGGNPPPPNLTCQTGTGPPITVAGTVLFERLTLDPNTGLGLPLITRPARFVDVKIRTSPGGTCYGEGSTDENGVYSITVMPPASSPLEVVVFSRTTLDPLRHITVHNANPPGLNLHDDADAFTHTSAAFPAAGSPIVDVTVPYNPGTNDRPSIGFGALDVLATCWELARTSPGVPTMPTLNVYTKLGNNYTVMTSYYSDQIASIVLLGGAQGNLDTTDTDYFDDPVIAHEFHHYVEGKLGHTLSRGGNHSGELLEPGFAWSEGHATGMGCLCIGTHLYTDTGGTSGMVLLGFDVDAVGGGHVTGIGSEQSVEEIVFDLADGGPDGPADTDGDGIGLSISDLYEVLFSFDPDTDAPYIGLFLDRIVANTSLTSGDVATLLGGTTGDPTPQDITYPLSGSDIWPVPLSIPSTVNGMADSATAANMCLGLTSSVWYRISIPSTQSITISLTITPSPADGDDLDLFLSPNTNPLLYLALSTNQGASGESIGPINLQAGEYLLRVEAKCQGLGNAAAYSLQIQ